MKTIITALLITISSFSFSQWTQYGQSVTTNSQWQSISMDDSGNIVAISDANFNYNSIQQTGLIQVYQFQNNAWTQMGNDIVIQQPNINLGIHIDLNPSGDFLVATATNFGSQSGTYVFEYDGSNWVQKGNAVTETGVLLEASIADNGGGFVTANTSLNEVKAYQWNGSDWIQFGSTISLNQFGGHVDMNAQGNRIAVGHIEELYDVVRVYEFSSDWVQLGSDMDGGPYQGMGEDLDLNYSGDALVTSNSVVGLVYEYNGTDWVQKGGPILRTGSGVFGSDVAINGAADRVLFNYPNANSGRGRGEVFDYQGGAWNNYGGFIENSNAVFFSGFGERLAMNGSGDKLILGTFDGNYGFFETYKDCPLGSFNTNVTNNNNTLTAAATGVTYQWVDCNNGNSPISGATSQSYTPSSNGSYAVIVGDGNCSEMSNCIDITTLSISDFSLDQLKVFPNPSKDGVFFLENDRNIDRIEITNELGQIVKELKPNMTQFNVEIESKGLYFLKVFSGNKMKVLKVVNK